MHAEKVWDIEAFDSCTELVDDGINESLPRTHRTPVVRCGSHVDPELDTRFPTDREESLIASPQLGSGHQDDRTNEVHVDCAQPLTPKALSIDQVQSLAVSQTGESAELAEQLKNFGALLD